MASVASIELPTDVATLAYAAGLFDGEGSISIPCPRNKREGHRKPHHFLQISVTSCDRELVDWMEDHLGGWVCAQRRFKPVGRSRPAYKWQAGSLHAEKILRALRPHLVLKGERADVALEFRKPILPSLYPRGTNHSQPLSDELYAKREALRQRLHELNVRGQDNSEEEAV